MKAVRIARSLAALVLATLLIPSVAGAVVVTLPYPIVPNTVANATQVQADFSTIYSAFNGNIDATNLASGSGIYASQMIPTTSAQATFGGTQAYTFPNNLTVTGNLVVNGSFTAASSTFFASQIIPTTTGQATFGGTLTYAFPAAISVANGGSFGATLTTNGIANTGTISSTGAISSSSGVSGTTGTFSGLISGNGVTSTGAIQQNVSSTNYTVPYDSQSTSASTKTHFEHGEMVTGTFSAGYACASHTFAPSYTAAPTITATLSGAAINPALLYINSKSTTSMQLCVESGTLNSGTALIDWISLGE